MINLIYDLPDYLIDVCEVNCGSIIPTCNWVFKQLHSQRVIIMMTINNYTTSENYVTDSFPKYNMKRFEIQRGQIIST